MKVKRLRIFRISGTEHRTRITLTEKQRKEFWVVKKIKQDLTEREFLNLKVSAASSKMSVIEFLRWRRKKGLPITQAELNEKGDIFPLGRKKRR